MTLRPCVLIGRRSGSADGRGQGQRQRAQMDQPQRIGRSWCRAATGTERGKGREPWWVQWVLVGTDELGAREVRCVGCSSNMSSVRRCQGREGCEGCECCTGGAGKCVCVVAGCRGTCERRTWGSAVRTVGTATLLYTHTRVLLTALWTTGLWRRTTTQKEQLGRIWPFLHPSARLLRTRLWS